MLKRTPLNPIPHFCIRKNGGQTPVFTPGILVLLPAGSGYPDPHLSRAQRSLRIFGPVYDAHAAGANEFHNTIVDQPGTDPEFGRIRGPSLDLYLDVVPMAVHPVLRRK